jgi:DNA primase
VADNRFAITRQVKDASDIVAVVGSYISLQPAGGNFKGICPFHQDTRPSLNVDPKWQNFRCWACGKTGDVFTFVEEFEKVRFSEALEILARRAGISLDQSPDESLRRIKQLQAIKWAEGVFQECLLESELGERARHYIGNRKLMGSTVRSFGLGYAPQARDWLYRAAGSANQDMQTLHEVGLFFDSRDGQGYSDRFRDRVMFPIRDARGQTVGFGGRILPDSPFKDRGPKYYNSSDTPLFSKKDLLYGLDVARNSAASEGFLAVVEGYTDVMMAHQCGVTNVVATMGTALNESHVRQLRRFVSKVVLVFDADAGGLTGVDRALEIFIGCDVELAIATLPAGMDPCDLLTKEGAEPFRRALKNPIDALDFKLDMLLQSAGNSVEGTKRVVDEILGIMALAPEIPGQAGQVKQELLITRLAHRLGLRQETIWSHYGEKKAQRRRDNQRLVPGAVRERAPTPVVSSGKTDPLERQLLEILLAEPKLVGKAYEKIRPEEMENPNVQRVLGGLYQLYESHIPADIDGLRTLIAEPAFINRAIELREKGLKAQNQDKWLSEIIKEFSERKRKLESQSLNTQLTKPASEEEALELLRKIQSRT